MSELEKTEGSGSLETAADAGKGASGVVKRWLTELNLAEKEEKDWRKDAERTVQIYRKGKKTDSQGLNRTQTFNILWANTETLRPALYNSTPTPDVRRRFRDADPLGKAAAQVLERCLDYSIDSYDFDDVIIDAVDDYLLPGRAVTRVRYVPTFAATGGNENDGNTDEPSADDESDGYAGQGSDPAMPASAGGDGSAGLPATGMAQPSGVSEADESDSEAYDEVAYEEVICEHVDWRDFRRGPGKRWKQVPWIAFRHKLDRDQLVEKFGKIGKDIEMDDATLEEDDLKILDNASSDAFKRTEVWEIWDRKKRQVLFISKNRKEGPLKTEEDPLGLAEFYPIPRPLYSLRSTDTLIPVAEYSLYEEQANELNELSFRITKIVKAMKVRMVYDSTISEMSKMFDSEDNEAIPADNVSRLMESGGIDKHIWFMPLQALAAALVELYKQREACKQIIYEITGIADIMRGSSEASETATAQNIKTQWGTLRVQRRQREVARYARDLLRLKAELIANKFGIQTLQQMSEAQYPTAADKAAAQAQVSMLMQRAQQAAMAQQQQAAPPPGVPAPQGMGQPGIAAPQPMPPRQPVAPPQPPQIPDELQDTLKKPSWEDIQGLLKDNTLRQFKIDVESDSTVAATVLQDQKGITDLLGGVVSYLQGIAPSVQSGAMPIAAAKALLMAAIRRFKLGSEVEDELDKIQAPKPPPAPPGDDGGAGAAAAANIKAQADIKATAMKLQADQQNQQLQAQTDKEIEQMKQQFKLLSDKIDAMTKMHDTQTEAQLTRERVAAEDARSRDQFAIGASMPTQVA